MSPPAEIPARRPGVCRLSGGMLRFADLLVRGVVCCRSDANSVNNRLGVRLPDRVGCQFVQFSSWHVGQVPPFSSFSSFSSVHELLRPWSACATLHLKLPSESARKASGGAPAAWRVLRVDNPP